MLNIIFSAIIIIIFSPERSDILIAIFVAATKGVAGSECDVASALAESILGCSYLSCSRRSSRQNLALERMISVSGCKKHRYEYDEISHIFELCDNNLILKINKKFENN